MRRLLLITATIILMLPLVAQAEVIREALVPVKRVIVVSGDTIPQAGPNATQIVFSTSGGIGLKNLERLDIVVDRYEQVQGVRITYRTGATIIRSLYIKNIKALVIEKAATQIGAKRDTVHMRIVTPDELTEPW